VRATEVSYGAWVRVSRWGSQPRARGCGSDSSADALVAASTFQKEVKTFSTKGIFFTSVYL